MWTLSGLAASRGLAPGAGGRNTPLLWLELWLEKGLLRATNQSLPPSPCSRLSQGADLTCSAIVIRVNFVLHKLQQGQW